MANEYFQFRRFTVSQERCAMKVGTDGTLLGAWAAAPLGPCRLLDVGTGTGLVALMMAQRFPEALVTGIDIDAEAVVQAAANAGASPFADRITILQADVRQFRGTGDTPSDGSCSYDAIVCNPPFFRQSLPSPDLRRTAARHTVSLSFESLAQAVGRLLSPEGRFSAVVPASAASAFETAFRLQGLLPSRLCRVQTTPQKPPKRCLMEFTKRIVAEVDICDAVLEDAPGRRSPWYRALTEAFYIK